MENLNSINFDYFPPEVKLHIFSFFKSKQSIDKTMKVIARIYSTSKEFKHLLDDIISKDSDLSYRRAVYTVNKAMYEYEYFKMVQQDRLYRWKFEIGKNIGYKFRYISYSLAFIAILLAFYNLYNSIYEETNKKSLKSLSECHMEEVNRYFEFYKSTNHLFQNECEIEYAECKEIQRSEIRNFNLGQAKNFLQLGVQVRSLLRPDILCVIAAVLIILGLLSPEIGETLGDALAKKMFKRT